MKNALGLKNVSTGPNVTLLEPYDEGVFYKTTYYGQFPVVSPVQLYLDLNGYKGRGEEAAQFLYEQRIEPLWSQKADYGKREVEAARSVLVELIHLLGEFRDAIVLVGGSVPPLLFRESAGRLCWHP